MFFALWLDMCKKRALRKNSIRTESNIASLVVYFIYKYSKGEMKMRFFEMASAQEQLALWRLISDNTWAAVEQQASEEAARKAQQKPIAKVGKKSAALKITPKPAMRLPTPTRTPTTPTPIAANPAANFQPPAAGMASNAAQPKVEPFKRLIRAGSSVKNGQEKSDDETDDLQNKNARLQ